MGDNKSKMEDTEYKFPDKEMRQFKRYIRDASQKGKRVSCFLVIAPIIHPECERNAHKLKSESGIDTDISLISAEDLKMMAETWQKQSSKTSFNLEVFNFTGVLDRETIKKRMKWYL